MTSRRVLLISLLLVGVLLSGCSRRTPGPARMHIKFWMFPLWNGVTGKEPNGTPEDWPKLVARQFEAKHPNVKIDIEMLTWQGGGQKLDLSVLSRTYPDICYYNASTISKYVEQGVLEPVDPYLTQADREDIPANILDVCKVGGRTYAWPFFCNTLVMAINADIFRERHVEDLIPKGPERSWTTDQFLRAAEACTFDRDGDGQTDVYGYALYGIPPSVEYQMLALILGHGAKLYSDDGSMFLLNSPEGVRGLQFLLDLQDRYKVVPPGAAGLQYGAITGMFGFDEKVAMLSCTSGTIRQIQLAASQGKSPKFDIVLVQPPHAKGKPCSTMLAVGSFVVFKQPNDEKRDMVMEFARFLTDAERSKALTAMGQFPARRSAGNLYPGDVNMATQARMVPIAKPFFTNQTQETSDVINNIYQQVFTHAATPKEALAFAEKKADTLMQRDLEDRGLR